ncbi:hypothetical protein HK407_01g00380 [Ordospora pajunii]|uniref:uncharacterized protein n=1 Tax=Ordospora pajunii TaxID=3039483 RepID=UPI0029527E18|nr:uncharacterized protein HK407_01g00380 [Ordospora pajunii]KAH9412146.1 hypothetical protein HK407_01g00380 [Ordospora pajunii]
MISRAMMKIGAACVLMSKVYSNTLTGEQEKSIFSTKGSESEAVQDVERTKSDDKYGIAQAEEAATSNVENPSSVEEGSESKAVQDVERTESDDKYGIAQAEEAENSNKDATALPHSAPLSNADGKPQAMKRVANGNKVLSAEEIKKRDEEFLKNFARVKDISEKI